MDKIRVLQFPISANNGVKTYALNNWKHLNKSKFACDFVIVRSNLGFEKEFANEGAGVKYLLSSPEKEKEQYIENVRNLLYGNYDVIHLHTSYWKRLLIEEIAMECKIPKVIVHAHNTQIDIVDEMKRKEAGEIHMRLREQFDRRLATDFCACSEEAAKWIFGNKIPRDIIRILRNAIDIEKYLFNESVRQQYRQLLGVGNNYVIGHIGRFSMQKNHDFLIEVFRVICKEIENARLLLIGEGPLESRMREKVGKLNLQDKVLFLGQRDDVPQLLQAMDLFCLPSNFEGLGIALIEAQASGLPCIVSDKVPREAIICNHTIALPLAVESWIREICEMRKVNFRVDMYEAITQAGYNIKCEIKKIDKLYSNF